MESNILKKHLMASWLHFHGSKNSSGKKSSSKRKTKSLDDLTSSPRTNHHQLTVTSSPSISPPSSPEITPAKDQNNVDITQEVKNGSSDKEHHHSKLHNFFFHHHHSHRIVKQRSLDTTDMTLISTPKFPRLSRLFRSRSDQGLKTTDSPSSSPAPSPKTSHRSHSKDSTSQPQRRRRLLRVVRDGQSEGEEWENPHVVRRYSKKYWEKQMEEARAIQHSTSLPYDVNTEQSILKKTRHHSNSTDSDVDMVTKDKENNGNTSVTYSHQNSNSSEVSTSTTNTSAPTATTDTNTTIAGSNSPTIDKHLSFSEDVEVVEFIGKEKITKQVFYKHEAKLVDSDSEDVVFSNSSTEATSCSMSLSIEDSTEEKTVDDNNQVQVTKSMLLKRERLNEFSKARESLESIEDEDEEEDDDNSSSGTNNVVANMSTSDTGGTTSDASQCSDSENSSTAGDHSIQKKQKKKKRSHLGRVKQKISRRLLGIHLQEEVDMTDSDSDTLVTTRQQAQLELIPEQ